MSLALQLPKGVAILLIHFYDLCNIVLHGLNEHMCLIVQGHAIQHNIALSLDGLDSLGQSKIFF
jgi:hypothetical protein